MARFIIRRTWYALITLFILSLTIFAVIRLTGDPVSLLAERGDSLPPSPAHRALELAIWSEKARIAPEEVKRLGRLWMRYFEGEPRQ